MSENLPEQDITLDLDAVEKPKDEQIPPFKVIVGGRTIVMTDPSDVDWQDLLFMESPSEFLHHCVKPEDREYLYDQRIPGWKFGHLMKSYQKHFKIDEKVDQARREQARAQRGI